MRQKSDINLTEKKKIAVTRREEKKKKKESERHDVFCARTRGKEMVWFGIGMVWYFLKML